MRPFWPSHAHQNVHLMSTPDVIYYIPVILLNSHSATSKTWQSSSHCPQILKMLMPRYSLLLQSKNGNTSWGSSPPPLATHTSAKFHYLGTSVIWHHVPNSWTARLQAFWMPSALEGSLGYAVLLLTLISYVNIAAESFLLNNILSVIKRVSQLELMFSLINRK